jgi:plasmid stability protein
VGEHEEHDDPILPLIAGDTPDIIVSMKQLLLRVPESVHRRLAARAAREGRSLNAVATEILDTAAEADRGDRRTRLRAAAAAAGTLRNSQARRVSTARRQRIIDSTRGLGAQLDRLLAQERERP